MLFGLDSIEYHICNNSLSGWYMGIVLAGCDIRWVGGAWVVCVGEGKVMIESLINTIVCADCMDILRGGHNSKRIG